MRKFSLPVFALFFCLSQTALYSQSVVIEVDGDNLHYSENGCGDCLSGPDPRWYNRVTVGGTTYNWDASRDDGGCGWQGLTNYNWAPPAAKLSTDNIVLQFNGREDDDGGGFLGICGADDANCNGYATLRTIARICDNAPYTWNYFTDTRSCNSDNTTGDWRIEWSYYWGYNQPPALTTQPVANTLLCPGSTTTLSVAFDSDACGRSMGRWYKWQMASTPTGPWTDIAGAGNTGGSVNTATTLNYTPAQISGTRYYRILLSSAGSADFSSATNTVTSATATVTYAFVASGAYGGGDAAPAIQSPICGSSVGSSQTITLNTLQPPTAGHVTNATYSWTASGGTPTTGTGSSFNWTSPATLGSQTISLTYNFGCANPATVTCTTSVSDPSCDFIYVSPSGTNSSTAGGPSNPCRTLSGSGGALERAALTGAVHIKMLNGGYTETAIIQMVNNLVIEGGYSLSGTTWVKGSNSTTNLSCSGSEAVAGLCHTMGVKASAVSNWKLIDLNITTVAASAVDASGRGCSNYAVWISGCSNYSIIRSVLTSGSAAAGAAGSSPVNAYTGGAGGGGGAGGVDGGNGCGCSSTNGSTGSPGTGGTPAGGGGGGARTCGGGCNVFGCNASPGGNGGNGTAGSNATSGGATAIHPSTTTYAAGNRPAAPAATNSAYYTPSGAAATGGNGFGGGGGGGGGGSDRGSTCTCSYSGNGNGGAGGRGGAGGAGGAGGKGGGGSFALFIFNSNTGRVLDYLTLSAGAAGTGGTGGTGSNGENGLAGAAGNVRTGCETRNGGAGGAGGAGSKGGRGQDGANGITAQQVIDGVVSSPSVVIPSSPAITVTYTNNMRLCKHSVFTINRTAGTGNWTLPANFDFVKYQNAATASEFNSGTVPADIYATSAAAGGYYNLQSGSLVFNSYIDLEADNRPAPVASVTAIDGSALPGNQICAGGSVKLANTAAAFGTTMEYDWEVYSGTAAPTKAASPGSPVFSSNIASPVLGPFLTAGTYIVRLQIREQCCGWSIPVFATFTVNADPTAPTDITTTGPTAAQEICAGSLITATGTSGAAGGVTPYTYQWDYDNDAHPYAGTFSNTPPSFVATAGPNKVKVRIQEMSLWGCDASPVFEKTITGIDLPIGDPKTIAACSGTPISESLTTSNAISGATFSIVTTPSHPSLSGALTVSGGNTLSGTITNTSASDVTVTYVLKPVGPASAFCNGSNFNVSVTIGGKITPAPSSNSPVCNNTALSLSGSASGGGGSYTYSWSGPGGYSEIAQNPTVTSNATNATHGGTYTLTVFDNKGCSTSQNTTVTVLPPFDAGTISGGTEVMCDDNPENITAGTTPSGAVSYSYKWYYQDGEVACPVGTNTAGWTLIAGATGASYDPPSGLTGIRTYARTVDATGANDCAPETWSGNCKVIYPSVATVNAISSINASKTCYVSGNAWKYFRNNNGELIAAVNANGQDLGLVTISVNVDSVYYSHGNGGLGRNQDCLNKKELSMGRFYTLTVSNTPVSGTTSLRLYYDKQDHDSYISSILALPYVTAYGLCYGYPTAPDDLAVSRNESADMPVAGKSVTTLGADYVIAFDVSLTPSNLRIGGNTGQTTQLSGPTTFRFHSDGGIGDPLPVELVSFTGWNDGAANQLQWNTVSEKNTFLFEVEKSSVAGSDWSVIGGVQASGNSQAPRNYAFTDQQPFRGNNYYRLKILDLDGSFRYSQVINIPSGMLVTDGISGVYPNPTDRLLNIDIGSSAEMSADLKIYDVLGQLVSVSSVMLGQGLNKLQLDITPLPRSHYILSYTDVIGVKHQVKFIRK